MTFAFYLGAGNIIFPPLAGFMAGEHLLAAMCGFLLTAVGLPLITLIAVAKGSSGGGARGAPNSRAFVISRRTAKDPTGVRWAT